VRPTSLKMKNNDTMKKLLFIVCALLLGTAAQAQRHEVGLFLGASYYNGDLNPSAPFANAQPAAGVAYRYIMNPRWAFKFNGYYGNLEAHDKNNPEQSLRSRNLHFRSMILEFAGNMEFNFMRFNPGSERERFSPFIFAGLSVFRFNPRTQFGGQWYDLQPLGTEGQGTTAYPDRSSYSLTSVGIPFGLGLKYSLGQNTVVALEWGMRKTFTDYIDDVSKTYADPYVLWAENTQASMLFGNRSMEDAVLQLGLDISPVVGGGNPQHMDSYAEMMFEMRDQQRGDESTKDWYSFVGITFTFQIKGPKAKKCDAYRDHYYFKEYRSRGRR
jgi:opacity protein-like surface antigen